MEFKSGQVAWLSINSRRVFTEFNDAINDAIVYNSYKYDDKSPERAYTDVHLVHLWLNGK